MSAGKNFGAFVAMFVAQVRDNTGITTTVTTAGTPLPVKGALFTEARNELPAAMSWSPGNGELTITGKAAAGVYDIEVIAGDAIGSNGGAKILRAAKNGVGVGTFSRETEPATAVRTSMGAAIATGVSLAVGDKVSVLADVATNGHVVITRDLTLKLTRVG